MRCRAGIPASDTLFRYNVKNSVMFAGKQTRNLFITLLHGQFFYSLRIVRDAMLGQALSKTTLQDSLSKRTEASEVDNGQVLPDFLYKHNECAFVF